MSRRYVPHSVRSRHRALLRNQIADLILCGSLTTTETRAKALKSKVERLISKAKQANLATRREVLALLPKEPAVEKLFERIVPQFRDRTGGFVRVVKLPPRHGDRAPMARVEFVEKIAESRGSVGGKQGREKTRKESVEKQEKGKSKGGRRRVQRDSAPKSV